MHTTYIPIMFSGMFQRKVDRIEYENFQLKSKLLAKVGVFNIMFSK